MSDYSTIKMNVHYSFFLERDQTALWLQTSLDLATTP